MDFTDSIWLVSLLCNVKESNTVPKGKKRELKDGLYVWQNWIGDVHRSQSSPWFKLLWAAWPLELSRYSVALRLLSLQLFFCNTPLGSLYKPWPQRLRQLEPVFPPSGLCYILQFIFTFQEWQHKLNTSDKKEKLNNIIISACVRNGKRMQTSVFLVSQMWVWNSRAKTTKHNSTITGMLIQGKCYFQGHYNDQISFWICIFFLSNTLNFTSRCVGASFSKD